MTQCPGIEPVLVLPFIHAGPYVSKLAITNSGEYLPLPARSHHPPPIRFVTNSTDRPLVRRCITSPLSP